MKRTSTSFSAADYFTYDPFFRTWRCRVPNCNFSTGVKLALAPHVMTKHYDLVGTDRVYYTRTRVGILRAKRNEIVTRLLSEGVLQDQEALH